MMGRKMPGIKNEAIIALKMYLIHMGHPVLRKCLIKMHQPLPSASAIATVVVSPPEQLACHSMWKLMHTNIHGNGVGFCQCVELHLLPRRYNW